MVARALLFDLDGTIWDSYPWYAAALHAEAGLVPDDTVRDFHNGNNVMNLAADNNVSRTRLFRACLNSVDCLNLYAGVRDVLDTLQKRGTKMGVVTNLSKGIAEPVLAQLGLSEYFGSIVCAAKKPSPSGIKTALRQLQIFTDGGVYYVGDSPVDGEAATRAGVPFAWASFGYFEARPPNTKIVLNEFPDILDL